MDLTPMVSGSTGVARYATELLAAVLRQGVDVAGFAFGRGRSPLPPGARHLRVPLRVVQATWRITGLPRAEHLAPGVQLIHSLDLIPPPTGLPLVATVHDLVALEHPGLHPARAVRQQEARLAALDRAEVVLADSHATADALVRFGVAADRVAVAQLGLTTLPPARPSAAREGSYVLAVGTLSPRKGLDTLVRALAAIPDSSVRAVLAGPDDGCGDQLADLAERCGVAARVELAGRVDDIELAGLYRDAALLCYPSVAEGFGLPVLESLASGLPVVATDLPVLRELAGDAAVYVPVGDDEALAGAMLRVLQDDGHAAALRRAGPLRARTFTWDATAEATVAAYARAVGAA
jgi:glycosyltransferase involved in cell wall biosynthesis